MMFRVRAFLAALVVGIGCGWVAFGGQGEAFSFAKAISVGLVSAYIVYVAVVGMAIIGRSLEEVDKLEEAFLERTTQLTTLRSLEKSAMRRGNLPGVSERLAKQFCAKLADSVAFPRWVASVSVYIGLGGTLIGLTCAVFALRNLNTDPELLKNQILSVVSGFGGSFACALCGILATVVLSSRLSRFDEEIEGLEDLAEIHVSEVVFRDIPSGDDRLADLVGQAVSQSLERVAEVWTTFTMTGEKFESAGQIMRAAADKIELAANRLSRQTETANEITKELSFVSSDAHEASDSLKSVVLEILPAFKALKAGIEALDLTLQRATPAIESTQSLEQTINLAQEVVDNLNARVAGIGGSVREEVKLASDNIVAYHQTALTESIAPPLKQLNRSMDLLVLLVDKAEQLLQNMPIAIPVQRIVEDLEAAGVSHLAASERDAKIARESMERMADAEAKLQQALDEMRSAHTAIASSINEVRREVMRLVHDFRETTYQESFWKKLGGRKA